MERKRPLLNIKLLSYAFGSLLLLEAACMLIPLFVAIGYGEKQVIDWIDSIVITAGVGLLFALPFRKQHGEWGKREGYLIVASIWVWFSFFSAIAFMLSGAANNFTDAFFESMSGFTTTGASVMRDVESLPHSVNVWRCFTQWLGGMGIIVLSLVLGFGGMFIYVAEATGPVKTKMSPRVRQTAAMLWGHYIVVSAVTFVFFFLGGMDTFDNFCHMFTTVSTGGFSTKNNSLSYWSSPFIHWAAVGGMFVSSCNFAVSLFFKPGKFHQALRDEEFRNMSIIFFALALTCSVTNLINNPCPTIEETIRKSTFMSMSCITGTGHSIDNFMNWTPALWILLLVAMCIGGSSGSTTGGIKIVRILLIVKNSYLEFKRLLHPRAIIPLKLNNKVITTDTINSVVAFIFLFMSIAVLATILLMFIGVRPIDAVGVSVSGIANIGLGFGSYDTGNFYDLPIVAKWIFSFLMLLGRLELFTVLFLFTPTFWKR